jgi:membrane protein required for colicin V production
MTGFDYVVVAILLVSVLLGVWRGFASEVLSLVGWPLAFLLSNLYADNFAMLLPIQQDALRATTAYVLIFVAMLIVWAVLIRLLSKLLNSIGLGQMDRMLGGFFGVVRGALVLLALIWLSGVTEMPEKPYWREAMMSKQLEDVALLTKVWLPENIGQRVHYRNRS